MSEQLWAGPPDDPDRYTLWAVIGGGAEGKVYRATRELRDGHLDVAVKVMLQDRFGTHGEPADQVAERWVAQAARLRNLNHPGLVGVQEAFLSTPPHPRGIQVDGRYAYFVMAWVEGRDLATWLAERSQPSERLGVLDNVADALDELHRARQVHADVKPGNVLVRSTALPTGATLDAGVLVDFGVMRAITNTRPSQVAFTAGYAAPELWQGAPYSPGTDLYALAGVVLFALTGEHPPVAQDAATEARRLLSSAGVPALTIDAVEAALHVDPVQRPNQGCRSWLAIARGGLTSSMSLGALDPTAPPTAPTEPVPVSGDVSPGPAEVASAGSENSHPPSSPPRRRRRRAAFAAIGLVAALLAAGAGFAVAVMQDGNGGAATAGETPDTDNEQTPSTTDPPRPTTTTTEDIGVDDETATTTTTTGTTAGSTPLNGSAFLSDLEPVVERNWDVSRDLNVDGTIYAHGLESGRLGYCGSNGPGTMQEVEYSIGRQYGTLHTIAGLSEDSAPGLPVKLEIFGDTRPLWTGTLVVGQPETIDLDVTDVLRLRFVATKQFEDPGGCNYVYAAMGDPTLA
jgi:eukaryotic-like serine/threonine-protein kinase